MRSLAETYTSYLKSQRLYTKVHEEFHSKGERSVAETARLVGFKLPHDPKWEGDTTKSVAIVCSLEYVVDLGQ